jgi:hypothetical protein
MYSRGRRRFLNIFFSRALSFSLFPQLDQTLTTRTPLHTSCNHAEEKRGESCLRKNAPCHPTLRYDGTRQGGPSPPAYKYEKAKRKKRRTKKKRNKMRNKKREQKGREARKQKRGTKQRETRGNRGKKEKRKGKGKQKRKDSTSGTKEGNEKQRQKEET